MPKVRLWQYIVMLCVSLLTGCAQFNLHTKQRLDSPIHTAEGKSPVGKGERIPSNDAILMFVASAEEGETEMITSRLSSESALISVGEFYNAASGRLCRHFFSSIPGTEIKHHACTSRIACQYDTGDWYLVRQIVNIDQSAIHASGCSSTPSD